MALLRAELNALWTGIKAALLLVRRSHEQLPVG